MFEPSYETLERLPQAPAEERIERSPFAEEARQLPDPLRRSLGWTLLLADRRPEIHELSRDVPFFSHAAIGFLSPVVDHELEAWGNPPLFGVILYAETKAEAGPEGEPGWVAGVLQFAEAAFVVVVRNGTYAPHRASPPAIHIGRLAAWATSRGGKRAGWLTARHVADDPGLAGIARVVDRGPGCIDAALVSIGTRPGGLTRVAGYTNLVPGLPIHLDLGVATPGAVLDVADNFGITRSSRFPLRFTTTTFGVPGDSGSLIEETQTANQDPLGMYLGSYTLSQPMPPHAPQGGIGLAISQLEVLMNLEVFR